MKQRRHIVRAATIIEIAMAIVILSVALPPLVGAFADASMQSILPVNEAIASFLAIDRMEEMVARRYAGTLDGVTGYDAITTANYPSESPVTGFSRFDRQVTVTLVDKDLNPAGSELHYKLVRVTVTWNGGSDQLVIERVLADFATPDGGP